MSNDIRTLADVQPGGRVRLATVPYDRARDLVGDAYNAGTHGIGYSQQAMELHDAIIPTQPSPGGQGDALPPLPPMGYEVRGTGLGPHDVYYTPAAYTAEQMQDYARAALAARQPMGEPFGWWLVDDNGIGRLSRTPPQDTLEIYRNTPGYMATPLYAAPTAQAVDLDELRRAVCVVGVVGQTDGHDVVRRNSVLEVIDVRRQRQIDSQTVRNG